MCRSFLGRKEKISLAPKVFGAFFVKYQHNVFELLFLRPVSAKFYWQRYKLDPSKINFSLSRLAVLQKHMLYVQYSFDRNTFYS